MNRLKGSDFEKLIIFRAQQLEKQRILTMGRYGVQATMMISRETGKTEWQIMKSLPDFEGCIFGSGRMIIIEAKVCSGASYPLYQEGKKKPRQMEHLFKRADAGALCFLLIHFNARELIRSSTDAITYAFPVTDSEWWREYRYLERKTITRQDGELHGFEVPWNIYSSRATKETPDLTFLLPDRPTLTLDA